jgi:succinoglycan biosynthesis transport protein ExoP
MKIIDFIRIILKNLALLIAVPIVLALLVVYLTKNPDFKYVSETTLFTGIATGSSVEMDKSFNYFVVNTGFDNLINIVKSRNTQKEVAIRLLSLHLMLDKPSPQIISEKNLNAIKSITPNYIYSYIAKDENLIENESNKSALSDSSMLNVADKKASDLIIPQSINKRAFEQTVQNLSRLMESNDTNFVYKLLNFPNPHYSFKDLSSIKVTRIFSSDMIQLKYESDDPGICQNTLAFLTDACIRSYRSVKENRSDAVIKYFENQLAMAAERLRIAEDNLLLFNKQNNIINYYEQSKAVAIVKEDLDVDYNNKRIKLAGIEAAIKRLEEKLDLQEQIQLKSSALLEKREQIGKINFSIAKAETFGIKNDEQTNNLAQLKAEAATAENELKETVANLYSYSNTKDGLPVATLLNEWISNVIEAENLKAGLIVLGEQIKEFQKQYAIYAPAGANIKRIEREISVSEQEFLEILHGLNLAKLKLQDNELASSLKVVDPPYFPLFSVPTKRKILVVLAAMVGFIFVLSFIIFAEYFDESLKNSNRASKILNLDYLGIIPKIHRKSDFVNLSVIINRLAELITQKIDIYLKENSSNQSVRILLFFSTQAEEGKSTIARNISTQFKKSGKKILFLNYSGSSTNKGNTIIEIENSDKIKSSAIRKKSLYKKYSINAFLDNQDLTESEYSEYNLEELLKVSDIDSFISNKLTLTGKLDYILIEIPEIIHYRYPSSIISNIDLPILVCRANRVWKDADQAALEMISKDLKNKPCFILNGTELEAIETILGDLPKKRSWLRKNLKSIVQLQFLTKTKI